MAPGMPPGPGRRDAGEARAPATCPGCARPGRRDAGRTVRRDARMAPGPRCRGHGPGAWDARACPGAGASPNIGPATGMPIPGPARDGAAGRERQSRRLHDSVERGQRVPRCPQTARRRSARRIHRPARPTESHVNNRKLFTSILDHSLSDDDFDDLIEKLDGYQDRLPQHGQEHGTSGSRPREDRGQRIPTGARSRSAARRRAGRSSMSGESAICRHRSRAYAASHARRSPDSPSANVSRNSSAPDPPRPYPSRMRGGPGRDRELIRPSVPGSSEPTFPGLGWSASIPSDSPFGSRSPSQLAASRSAQSRHLSLSPIRSTIVYGDSLELCR